MRGTTAVSVNTCAVCSPSRVLHVWAHVWMFCVNQLSGGDGGGGHFFSPHLNRRWVNLCFMEIKYGPHPPLPASRWSLWREGDYLAHLSKGTWECWCWVGSAVPRQASCPQEPEYDPLYLPPVSGPLPPSSTPSPARLTATPPPPPPILPLSTPQDRLSSTWQGLAWITGIPGQVSQLMKVSSASMCFYVRQRNREGENL